MEEQKEVIQMIRALHMTWKKLSEQMFLCHQLNMLHAWAVAHEGT